MPIPTIYGIKSCDSVRRARKWFRGRGRDHRFHDVRADGIDAAHIERWLDAVGPESLINRRGRAWRQLTEAERARAMDAPAAVLAEHPLLIKRPVVEFAGVVTVGLGDAQIETWQRQGEG